jgi:carboxyvinyl-carboxyphosphonate phosphorylmutase
MKWAERRQRFRAILDGQDCIFPASVFDPLSARIAEDLGYELGMFAGSTGSLTVLAAPDIIVLTASEFAQQALRICRAVRFPLLVDADHGYGNALNATRTIEELDIAGVAAATIEDTRLPTPFASGGKVQLTSVEEGAAKLRAALTGRADKAFGVIGRTSALALTGLDDAIVRFKAYEQAGVDALFVIGIKDLTQLKAVSEAVSLPLILGGAPMEFDRSMLAAHRVRICLQGHLPIRAAVQAIYDTMKALRDGTAPQQISGLASPALMDRITHAAQYREWTRDFLDEI